MLFHQLLDIRLPAPYDVRPSSLFRQQPTAEKSRWTRRRRPPTLPPWKYSPPRRGSWRDARRPGLWGRRG
ncbi:hypothetical protein ACFY36_41975 [Actinoplanes sp. NPDC000266]